MSDQPGVTPSRPRAILDGLREQNEPAEFEGRRGFWVQGDCIFVECGTPHAAIVKYRHDLVATSHNHFCGSIMREKDRFRAEQLEQENATLRELAEGLAGFADDVANGYDCDTGANNSHPRYCRACRAKELYARYRAACPGEGK